ncbi:MAG: hypothetical protein R3E98_04295 [Gemmatimonadota bacterium]|nr:hypothetical protein [Gemmatimonadota bacterium]
MNDDTSEVDAAVARVDAWLARWAARHFPGASTQYHGHGVDSDEHTWSVIENDTARAWLTIEDATLLDDEALGPILDKLDVDELPRQLRETPVIRIEIGEEGLRVE